MKLIHPGGVNGQAGEKSWWEIKKCLIIHVLLVVETLGVNEISQEEYVKSNKSPILKNELRGEGSEEIRKV